MTGASTSDLLLGFVLEAARRREEAEKHFRYTIVGARTANVPLARIADAAGLSVSRIHAILGEEQNVSVMTTTVSRPAATGNDQVLVVAAGKSAWQDYLDYSAYFCQPDRSFRHVDRMGFYRRGQIEPLFPRLRYRRLNLDFAPQTTAALRATGAGLDREVADLIDRLLDERRKHRGGLYQVILLTPSEDPQTLRIDQPIRHETAGRGSAWTMGTRYTTEEAVRRSPATTSDL